MYAHIGYRDYDRGPYNAVFPALTTTASFNIIIFDNHTFEGYETFNLTINPPSYVFQGDPSQVTATILDHRGNNSLVSILTPYILYTVACYFHKVYIRIFKFHIRVHIYVCVCVCVF